MKRILVIEDDITLSMGLCYYLEAEKYIVNVAYTIKQAIDFIVEKTYDLIVLDVNLPDGNGFDLCRKVKKEHDIPIIFLTACDLEKDQMKGFDYGADDYITKPFSIPVFQKRVEAMLKRCLKGNQQAIYNDGFLIINFDQLTAMKGSEQLILTPTEYKLLKLLIRNYNMVLTRKIIIEKIWDDKGNFVDEHALTVNINRLRAKLEDEKHKYIKTVYGMGYQWTGEVLNRSIKVEEL